MVSLPGLSVCAWLLASAPWAQRAPGDLIERGPQVTPGDEPLAALRGRLPLHAETSWRAVTIPLAHGGALVIAQEFWDGLPVAHSRLALRLTPDLRLRQVIGRALAPGTPLPRGAAARGPRRLWWPDARGLIAARLEHGPLRVVDGRPQAETRVVALATGEVLAAASSLDEYGSAVTGWLENPVTTPAPYSLTVDLPGDPPLALESEVFRVVQCAWDEEAGECAKIVSPLSGELGEFPDALPDWDDAPAQADPEDPYAAVNALHVTTRFVERLLAWGWDPAVWEVVNCEWQELPPEECRVEIVTNVRWSDSEGAPIPFNGAVYRGNGEIHMGQGTHADAAYDLEVLVHEFGHHVTRGHGAGEPIGWFDDGRFVRDRGALNEGSSDVFASFMGQTPELYDYFRNLGGLYLGPRARDVSIPFRCPENVAGELHMEGRIWASAMYDIRAALLDAGLGDEDAFPAIFYGANAAIRNFPADQQALMADASLLLADEVELALGPDAGELARAILEERGLLACSYQIDINQEPSITGIGDPSDPLHARFVILPSYNPNADPTVVAAHPLAPAVQHRVTLTPSAGEDDAPNQVTLEFVPDRWRTTQPLEEPLDQKGLVVAALVKPGGDPVLFWRDEESDQIVHDAELVVPSAPLPGDVRHAIVIQGLEPGATYAIALVSQTAVTGDLFLVDEMEWRLELGPEPMGSTGSTGAGETSETDGDPPASTGDESAGATDGGEDISVETGCNCAATRGRGTGSRGLLWLAALALLRRRRA